MNLYITLRFIALITLLTGLIFLHSCTSDDPEPSPNPTPSADFDVTGNSNLLEVGKPVQFINLSKNAATYRWSIVDAESDTIHTNTGTVFEFNFTKSGTYEVILRAWSEDMQLSTQSKTFQIKRRILNAFTIANISFVDQNGDPWDDDETGPDLTFFFGPQSDTELERTIWTDTVANVGPADLPITWSFDNSSTFILSDELFDLFILDIDEEAINPEDQAEVMFGLELNPVTYEFSDIDQTGNGLIQISLGGFSVDLFFDIQLAI
jgi:hypothetical protein